MSNPEAAPARLGRYELLARLAAGGMGEIFLARLEGAAGFEKLFVIKRILPHLAGDARFRAMLIAEARIASMMAHANICQVYELGETDGQLYIAMEYLEGVTLLPVLRKLSKDERTLELGFVAGTIQQATDALHYAHELRDRGGDPLGIVHRDVTPANLFLTEAGVVKILDFGIAKVKNASAHTQTGTVKGKYAYMAPEQLRGAGVDRRADVFALGIVVYEMLALRRLFQRQTDYLTFRAVMEQPIIDIRRYRPDCPDRLASALTRALDRNPALRFDTARQFGTAVVDAIATVARPWTQGEIGDFVRAQFTEEIVQRGAQVASAVRSGSGHHAIPLIAPSEAAAAEADDDAEFPAVGSELAETPVERRHLRRPTGEQAAILDPSDPGVSLDALRATPGAVSPPSSPVVVVSPRRSLVWPLVAFAMVAVAGGALFLVWRQMQNQQPTSLVITGDRGTQVTQGGSNVVIVGSSPGPSRPEPGAGASGGRAGGGSGDPPRDGAHEEPAGASGERRDPPGTGSTQRRRPTRDPYNEVVRAKQPDAHRCATEHGNPPPGTSVKIVVGPDGHPKTITITPERVDATPLGACIKTVFKAATFPRGARDHDVEVKLVGPA